MLFLYKNLNIMAVIKRGILGGFANKIGNVVGSSWKGIAVIKSLPLSVANPNTVNQQNVRRPFKACVALASLLLGIFIKKVWNRGAMQMSGFNAFVQANVKTAFQGSGAFTPVGLNISPSTESPAVDTGSSASYGSQDITVQWNTAKTGNMQDTDLLIAVVLNENGIMLGSSSFGVARSAGSCTINGVHEFFLGSVINVYYMFQSADGFRNFGQTRTGISVGA